MPGILSCFDDLTLTHDQQQAAVAIEEFLTGNDPVLLLRGYAGTGKTTLLGGVCRYITDVQQREVRLMAPTGRAARILGLKNSNAATTIHRGIYNFHELKTEEGRDEHGQLLDGFQFVYTLASDADIVRQVFVIDEASMVSDAYSEGEFFRFGSGFLLHDLLTFAKVGQQNIHTQLIFVGDPAQLPPFGMNHSPALSEAYFQDNYRIQARSVELREVVRQGGQSGVLALATQVREGIASGYFNQFDIADNEADVRQLPVASFWQSYAEADKHKIIITYKNKTARDINNRVRATKFGPDAPALLPGDMVIVGMNNYQHGVTNGTFGTVQDIGEVETRTVYIRGERPVVLRWQSVGVLVLDDTAELRRVQANVLLNFLESDEGRLSSAEMRGLFVDFTNRASERGIKPRTPEFAEALKTDPYFAALMLKHAYAITCHKAQGGEWKSVFTFWDKNTKGDFDVFADAQTPEGRGNSDFFRWAYTAITRSSHQLYAVNPPRFTPFSKLVWIDTALVTPFLELQGVGIAELPWDETQQALMERLGLATRELFVQHKIAALSHVGAGLGIRIESVKSSAYLETISFGNMTGQVSLNYAYNGKRKFTRPYKGTGSDALYAEIETLLPLAESVTFALPVADVAAPAAPDVPADGSSSVGKPFIDVLRQRLPELTIPKAIRVMACQSLDYRERGAFERGGERAVLDFIYDGDGFFTRVQPVANECNSAALLSDLRQLVQTLRI